MKTGSIHLKARLPYLFFLLMAFVYSVNIFAQDATKKIDVDISTHSDNGFFASPWIWVVGGAVFILLLVALLRGSGRRTDA